MTGSIIRRPSPSETLGGGTIIDPQPKGRHKRFDESTLTHLDSMLAGSPSEVILQASLALGAASINDVYVRSRLDSETAFKAFSELLSENILILLENGEFTVTSEMMIIARQTWQLLISSIHEMLDGYHQQFPLRRGMPREELKSRLQISPRLFNLALKKLSNENMLMEGGTWVSLPGHEIQFDPHQQVMVKELLGKCASSPFAPPSVKEMHAVVGEDVYAALVELDELVQVSNEVAFRKTDYELMVGKIRAHIENKGQISVAETRDLFSTSRKYVLPLLEHLDNIGMTLRDGDFRRLKK